MGAVDSQAAGIDTEHDMCSTAAQQSAGAPAAVKHRLVMHLLHDQPHAWGEPHLTAQNALHDVCHSSCSCSRA